MENKCLQFTNSQNSQPGSWHFFLGPFFGLYFFFYSFLFLFYRLSFFVFFICFVFQKEIFCFNEFGHFYRQLNKKNADEHSELMIYIRAVNLMALVSADGIICAQKIICIQKLCRRSISAESVANMIHPFMSHFCLDCKHKISKDKDWSKDNSVIYFLCNPAWKPVKSQSLTQPADKPWMLHSLMIPTLPKKSKSNR